jgi:hypothetical protein
VTAPASARPCDAPIRFAPQRSNDPPPGFVEVDFVAHAGTAVAGSFVQTIVLSPSAPQPIVVDLDRSAGSRFAAGSTASRRSRRWRS